ncbi:LytTR family DNA-binding domain-containing protein [Phenylobacterium sp.]|uniref:LytTR family DNA-binding domain-containing protein n=1 Tax=Phenylobacterium sp. TaxID=1871053 RepID=UPI002F935D58
MDWGPWSDWRGWARGMGVSVVVGVFLSLAGAFGTDELPMRIRVPYWVGLLALGTIWGAMVARLLLRPQERKGRWLRVALTAVVMSGPFTFVVATANRLLMGEDRTLADAGALFAVVTVISLAMTTLNVLIESRRALVAATPPAPPKFLERLPLKLRGAEVWAVEAEDHYLRLHTSKGQDLILLRLADAIAELEGIEGMQVHRSWWVARDAITDAKRADGRATLTLKDGCQVPVSRTYAAQLREKRWI